MDGKFEGLEVEESWTAKMRKALGPPSRSFAEMRTRLIAANHGFHLAMGEELQAAANVHLGQTIGATDETKKQAVDDVRNLLAELNLAVVCPRTKRPSLLYAIAPSSRNKHVQYWLRPRNAKTTTFSTNDLEKLLPIELTEGQARQEGLSLWRERVSGDGDDSPSL